MQRSMIHIAYKHPEPPKTWRGVRVVIRGAGRQMGYVGRRSSLTHTLEVTGHICCIGAPMDRAHILI